MLVKGAPGGISDKSGVAYFTVEVNPSLAKQPLNLNGGLAKLGMASIVK